jgi:hypothetical protein
LQTVLKKYRTSLNYRLHYLRAKNEKYIVLQALFNSGSEYFNYKGQFSIILFATVDANYNFIYVDVECQGRISHNGVYKNSSLYKMLEKGMLIIPLYHCLNERDKKNAVFFP